MKRQVKNEVDFFSELKLYKPISGLVHRVTSSKGVRKETKHGRYEYALHETLLQIYDENKSSNIIFVEDGLYWVLDICKPSSNGLIWNNYLIVVEDGELYPVGEYLECGDTTWIKKAMPVIKAYFNEEDVDVVDLTIYKKPVNHSRWGKLKK